MDIKEWINRTLPDIADRLEADIQGGFHVQTEEGLNISGRNEIYEILDSLLAVLFPGAYSRERIPAGELNFFIADTLRHVSYRLKRIVEEILEFHCARGDCDDCDCDARAVEVATLMVGSLPEVRRMLVEDIEAAFDGDPAAKSMDEILLSYPCIEAIATYRIAHRLYAEKVPIIPRIMSERAHSKTGIDIHPGARIGSRFFIDHGTGVVIGETCTIGSNVKIYQGVTLGALSPFDRDGRPLKGAKRHPDIGDDVIIYANATILGGETVIGSGSVIGGNTWITTPVPAGSKVFRDGQE